MKLRWINCTGRIFTGVRHEEREGMRERGVFGRVWREGDGIEAEELMCVKKGGEWRKRMR